MSTGTVVFVVWLGLILAYLLWWAMTLRQIVRTSDEEYRAGNQILWSAVVVFIPLLGILVYRIVGAPRRR